MQVPTDGMPNLLNYFVLQILKYGCEVHGRGFFTVENIERVHRKFCIY